MSTPYLATSLPEHQVAELHRLMTEEIKEVAVFFMDTDGIITVWNRAAEEMKGYTAQDAIGSHLSLLYTDEENERGWAHHNLKEAKANGFYREEAWRKRKDGSLFWARIALTALRDHAGVHIGFSKVTVDLTEHKRLERCVKEREQTRRILRTANAGTWTWHPDTGQVEVCANFLGLLGHPNQDATMPFEQWLEFVAPADRSLMAEKLASAHAAGPGSPLVMETRMCARDGNCRWFYVHADWYRETPDDPYVLSGVNVDIQELRTASEELRQAVDKLREADARKDEFLAMLAHELRNPLAPIRSAAELLKIARLEDAQVRKTSQIIARQVDHMTSLVDDLLDVSRVTRGLVTLEKEPLDIDDIVTDALEQVRPLVQSRHQHLAVALSADAAAVHADKKRMVQVVGNLLNNAAKYTPENGHLLLKTEVGENEVVLSIIDDGIGMEPELAGRVFDLFTQAARTPDRSSGGLGLGLALVKSLVELHGGTVSCASQGLGKGSCFSVRLPLLAADAKAKAKAQQPGSGLQASKPLRVMIVDDNEDAAQMLAMFLEASGHQVLVEYGARRALERARIEPPDVYLLDIGLPEIDGNELAQRIRAQPETANGVLIAVTGYGQEHDRKAALAAGFRHHLVKPVDPAKLVALLSGMGTWR
ncbi:MAG: putative histidine kinase, hybrid [Polaromonas sp.]|nr:putative histidine kinase, hybrid [Polaromonas sp.]